ncbi:MAG: glutaminase A [Thermoleophilia bacterium]
MSTAPASSVRRILQDLHATVGAEPPEGAPADYIPELADADPDHFGVATVTTDGDVNEVGDTGLPFTIQSISKPLLYGLALEDHGLDGVRAKVGVEPTGEAFNSIRLDAASNTPLNPMVNAGAIATTGMVGGATPAVRLERVLAAVGRYVGRPVAVDEAVYRSEAATGHRNRAIAHLLRNFDVLEGDPEEALDLYFRQCSILVTCRDLAMIGATLANRGVNPVTGERALEERHVAHVLSVMATCGMYDAAGQWLHDVGLPAKSGVAGGVLAVLPGQIGIAAFSPPLDEYGNSVRGVRVCGELSRRFALHLFETPRPGTSAIRRRWTIASAGSRRRRPHEEQAVLQEWGHEACVYEVHGDLGFTAAAALARAVADEVPEKGFAIFDVARVTGVNRAAATILADLRQGLDDAGTHVVVVDPGNRWGVRTEGPAGYSEAGSDLDAAIEWCEDLLLLRRELDPEAAIAREVPLAGTELCREMSAEEVAELAAAMERHEFAAGEVIVREGDPPDDLLVVARGRVRIEALGADGGIPVRLAVVGPGMLAGEGAFVDGLPRSASGIAETGVVVHTLSREAFAGVSDHDGLRTRSRVLAAVARCLADRMRRTSAELSAMS